MLLDTGSRITILHKCLDRRTAEAENIAKFPLLKCYLCFYVFPEEESHAGKRPCQCSTCDNTSSHILE